MLAIMRSTFADWILRLRGISGAAWDGQIRDAEARRDAELVEEAQRDRDDCLDQYDSALLALDRDDLGAARAALNEAAIREHHHGLEPLAVQVLNRFPLAS